VRSAIKLCGGSNGFSVDANRGVGIRFQPHGVVGLITPWNNPIAIPLGKIGAALALGNGIVWKPAIEAPRSAMAVINALQQAGLPDGTVNLVFGNAATARWVIDCSEVAAVSLTGAIVSGHSAIARCARLGKPLQAELGGNNAAIVLGDCETTSTARAVAHAAFSFAGQRCTALRRIIVERSISESFQQAFVEATESLRIGEPCDPTAEVGPLNSLTQRQNVQDALEQARSDKAQVLCGGIPPPGMEHGCWLTPAIVNNIHPAARLAQEETFGPVAVILPAADLDEALAIANEVEHGLVAALYSQDERSRRQFAETIQAGILKFSPEPLGVHPDAPCGGWKSSGIGPPEHGLGDRQFYSRPQATYGWSGATDLNA
jgi:acyl-CoA reductase-like NAD-dependent aldehyde dehydrogenase